MNLFVTDECPVKSAQHHCNVHNVKMIVEVAQMLSTAHFVLDGVQVGYKPTHKNHPCSIWIRETSENYNWAFNHLKALCDEYTYRTGKVHKTSELLDSLAKQPSKIVSAARTQFVVAAPDKHKITGIFNPIKGYQDYLNEKFAEWACRDKPIRVQWTKRNKPEWLSI